MLTYEKFSNKVLRTIKKKVINNRVDENDVLNLKYKERFIVYLGTTTGLNTDPFDLLCIEDTEYDAINDRASLYKIYERIKAGEITEQAGIDEALEKAEDAINNLIERGVHHFDEYNALIEFNRKNGLVGDYSAYDR